MEKKKKMLDFSLRLSSEVFHTCTVIPSTELHIFISVSLILTGFKVTAVERWNRVFCCFFFVCFFWQVLRLVKSKFCMIINVDMVVHAVLYVTSACSWERYSACSLLFASVSNLTLVFSWIGYCLSSVFELAQQKNLWSFLDF